MAIFEGRQIVDSNTVLITYDLIHAVPIRPTDSDATICIVSILNTTENSLIYMYCVCESVFTSDCD